VRPFGVEDRSYRISGLQPYGMLAVLVVLTAFAPFVVASRANRNWFTIVWLGILAWFWFNALVRAAYRIDVVGEAVEIRSLARCRHTTLSGIRSIKSRQAGFVTIRFDGGRFDLIGAVDGFHDFVTRVKSANPAVELQGV
jgi:hypothetical protein